MSQGIIVGSDANTEWLLPWWWKHYSHHNSYPVTFVNFGLSQKMASWCQNRGSVINLKFDETRIAKKSEIKPELVKKWEEQYGQEFWKSRPSWFKKPFAMRQSPYDLSIWLDLDCEVCKNLEPLYQALDLDSEVGMVDTQLNGYYNSGVIVFRKNSALIEKWSELCLFENALYCGDDQVLNLAPFEKKGFQELPLHFNWMALHGINFRALIFHWHTPKGKAFIKEHGGFQAITKDLKWV